MASRKFRSLFHRQPQPEPHSEADSSLHKRSASSSDADREALSPRNIHSDSVEEEEPYSPSHTLGFRTSEMTREDLIKALESTVMARDDAVGLLKTASQESGAGTLLADMKSELDQWKQEASHLICQQSNAQDQESLLTTAVKPEDLRTVQLRMDECRNSITELETRLCNTQETIDSLRKTVNTLQIQNSALRADNNYLRTKVVRSSSRRDGRDVSATAGFVRSRASSTEPSVQPNKQYFSLPQSDVEKERRSSMESSRSQFVNTLGFPHDEFEGQFHKPESSTVQNTTEAARRFSICSMSSDQDSLNDKDTGNVSAPMHRDLMTSPISSSVMEQESCRPSFDGRESLEYSLDEWAEFSSASTLHSSDTNYNSLEKPQGVSQGVEESSVSSSVVSQKLNVKPPPPPKSNHRRARSDMVYRQQSAGWTPRLNGTATNPLEGIAEEAGLAADDSVSNSSTNAEGSITTSGGFQLSPVRHQSVSSKNGRALETIFGNISLFNSLDRTEQAILASRFEMRRYSDQDSVHSSGDPADNFFVVVEGCVTALPAFSRDTFSQQDLSQTRHFTEGDYFLGEEIQDGQAIARGETSCLLLPSGVLTQVLEWFANARRMSDMVEAANLKSNPQQQEKIHNMQLELQNANEFKTLQSVIRRHSSTARAIPLSKSKKDDILSFYYQLEQARTDLIREESVLLNGSSFKLGSEAEVNYFFNKLRETLSEKLSSIVNVENFARVGVFSDGEKTRQSILENLTETVLVSSCRTEAGGASYAHCLKLLGNNPYIVLTSDASSSSPTDIVIHEGHVQIQSENMYRLLWSSRDRNEGNLPVDDEEATPLCGLLRAVSTETITIQPRTEQRCKDASGTAHPHDHSGNEGGKLSKLFPSKGKKKRNSLMGSHSSNFSHATSTNSTNAKGISNTDVAGHAKDYDNSCSGASTLPKKQRGFWGSILNRNRRSRDARQNQNRVDGDALSRMTQQEELCQQFLERSYERHLRILCKPVE